MGHIIRGVAFIAAVCGSLAIVPVARAQNESMRLGGELDDYVRMLQLGGKTAMLPLLIRPAPERHRLAVLEVASDHLWSSRYPLGPVTKQRSVLDGRVLVRPIAPEFQTILNSRYPWGRNDGPTWAGRGATAAITGGVYAEWGPLSANVEPVVYWAQNRDFDQPPPQYTGLSEFAYRWSRGIDWPTRFGPSSVTQWDWGQSGIRLDLGPFTAGISNENMWWGPSFNNAMIMSNAGPGFAHVDLGTGRPVWIGIGHIEVRSVWGRLVESPYFDTIPSNDARFLAGMVADFRPRWLPGLTIGGSRVLYRTWPADGIDADNIFSFFTTFFKESVRLPDGTIFQDSTDQLGSLFARWVFPESGFEAYLEWARNDFSGNPRDLLLEPDHSQAYTFGFQKVTVSGSGRVRLRGEWTHLGRSPSFQVRATPTYYVHGIAKGGYTHRGQLVGAWIGPGSNSQHIGVDRYGDAGRIGVFLERVRYNDDAYFQQFGDSLRRNGHDVEVTLGLSALRFVGDLDVGAALAVSRRLNFNFQLRNDVTNVNARISVKWRVR